MISSLVAELAARGIQLWVDGSELRFRAPKGSLTATDRARIAERRSELIEHLTRTSIEDAAALAVSFAQERLWFFDQLQPGSGAYNLPMITRVFGPLEVRTIEASLTAMLERHHVLRSTFQAHDGRPRLVLRPVEPWRVPVTDLRTRPDAEPLAIRLANEDLSNPFDLATGPLYRARLYQTGEQRWVFAIIVHHIVSDGWSLTMFARELAEHYIAQLSNRPFDRPPLAMQYADFAAWQRRSLNNDTLAGALGYWLDHLRDAPRVLELPLDRRRPPVQTFGGASIVRMVDPEVMARFRDGARANSATLFMALLAAFTVVLARQAGVDDLCVGVPVSGRTLPETEPMIGLFVDTLVLRVGLRPRDSFADVIAHARQTTLGGFAHQGVPMEKLVEELLPVRDLSRTPLFQVLFNVMNFRDADPPSLPGLHAEVVRVAETSGMHARFDLTLYVQDQPDGTLLTAAYNTALFDAARAEDLLEQVVQVISAGSANPAVAIGDIPLVTSLAARVLPNPAAPIVKVWSGAVQDRVRRHAQARPMHLAASDGSRELTYAELDQQTNQLANHLRALGVQRGDRVAIYAARNVGLVWAMLGVLKAGAAFVILDPAYPAARLESYVRIAAPRAVVNVTDTPLPPALAASPVVAWNADDWTGQTDADPSVKVDGADLAYIVFTSGSTGEPKGIEGEHAPLSHFFEWHERTFALTHADRFSVLSGLAHDPLLRDVLAPLWVGASMHFPDGAQFGSPGYLARWLDTTAISVAHLTPAIADLITIDGGASRITSLRRGFFGADALQMDTVEAMRTLAPHATWTNFYGASETPQAIAFHPITERAHGQTLPRVPVGKGIADVQLLVLNERGVMAGIGELGEIHVRTPYLARGYAGAPAMTAERFITNPFTGAASDRIYRTGDLGRYRADGSVEFCGRRDGQVKIRGFRIELAEVESALREDESVQDAVAVVDTNAGGDARVVAYVVPTSQEANGSTLRSRLRRRLPEHMLPEALAFLAAIPLTPNGKVNRAALPPVVVARQTSTPGRTPTERAVADIWQEILVGKTVGVDDNFFELGGHSLLATRVLSRVRSRLGVNLPLRSLFEAPTVAEFARAVDACSAAPTDREDVVI